jgi:acyl transferase domain-containing protein/thioesterase domain-containing protein
MSNSHNDPNLLKMVAYANKLENNLNALNYALHEPIAIIGMSCRFPGANNLDSYWNILTQGVDTIKQIPKDRFNIDDYYDPNPDVASKTYARAGGFIDDVDKFDPAFFGISPREAIALDPQQRLLHEVVWEAIEHAGLTPQALMGSKTGVFVGMATGDYQSLILDSISRSDVESHIATGTLANAAAGRLSYTFGLQGPSITVDTACSSSLVAIHLACENLRNSACDVALAAGVNVILSPEPYILLSKIRALAFDSHCKTFDKDADGYARGEGCGVLVLKRLSDAQRDRDLILATIRGSAVNHDGHSNSFTAPNGLLQELLIKDALSNARINASDVSYIEAHGTGTPLGDPIEVQSLGNILKVGRPKELPLVIGTVKTNIGHTESAAGIAGVIKVVLAMRHKQIPAHLNFKELNPAINLEEIPAIITTKTIPWDNFTNSRIAGVSSFGISGTNAHMVLEEYTELGLDKEQLTNYYECKEHILCVSAKTINALAALKNRYIDMLLKNSKFNLADLCYSANCGRGHFDYRLAINADNIEQLVKGLEDAKISVVPRAINKVFMFTGQGSQFVGMGKELYVGSSVFKNALDECNRILVENEFLDKNLLSLLWGDDSIYLDDTIYTQPALFSIEYSLYKLFVSWGIVPRAVIGHSVGEYVAACVAGVFTLEDGLKLISKRADLMQSLPRNGAMTAIAVSEQIMLEAIKTHSSKVNIAAINGPESVVISGDIDMVKKITSEFAAKNIKTKELKVSHAFHSHLLEPMLNAFYNTLSEIEFSEPKITLISNLTGEPLGQNVIVTKDYWVSHTRNAVRFYDGIKTLINLDFNCFIEVGPQPVLSGIGQECILDDTTCQFVPSMRKDVDEWQQILVSLGKLYVCGNNIDWRGFYQDYKYEKIQVPSYPFQNERYWFENGMQRHLEHRDYIPILGYQIKLPLSSKIVLEAVYNIKKIPLLLDHKAYNIVVVAGSVHIARILMLATNLLGNKQCMITDLIFEQAIAIFENESYVVQVLLESNSSNEHNFKIYSISEDEYSLSDNQNQWSLNATGKLILNLPQLSKDDLDKPTQLQVIKNKCNCEILIEKYRSQPLFNKYFQYGPGYTWVEKLWQSQDFKEVLGLLRLPKTFSETNDYELHPGLIDSCLQLLSACNPVDEIEEDVGFAYVPLSISEFIYYRKPKGKLLCHIALNDNKDPTKKTRSGNINLYTEIGDRVVAIENFVAMQAPKNALIKSLGLQNDNLLYEIIWEKIDKLKFIKTDTAEHKTLLFIPKEYKIYLDEISKKVLDNVGDIIAIYAGTAFEKINSGEYTVNPYDKSDFEKLLQVLSAETMEYNIAYLWALESNHDSTITLESIACEQKRIYLPALYLAQNMPILTKTKTCNLYLVTSGAQPSIIDNLDFNLSLSQSTLWGLGKVLSLESPNTRCILIDLDPIQNSVEENLFIILDFIDSNLILEDQVAIRQNQYYVPRLTQASSTTDTQLVSIRSDVSYMVTGGLGGIGLLAAKWLADKGAKNIILIGRTEGSNETLSAVSELRGKNINIQVFIANLANLNDVSRVFYKIIETMPTLQGIIHAAGVLDDALILEQKYDNYINVINPKIYGTWNLHQNIIENNLKIDFFVSFSAVASLIGNVGQINYAAANSFLDLFSYYQKAHGIPALTINWGPWDNVGMTSRMAKAIKEQLTINGVNLIAPEKAFASLDMLLNELPHITRIAVLDINWKLFHRQMASKFPRMFEKLISKFEKNNLESVSESNYILVEQLINSSSVEQTEILATYLENEVRNLLRIGAGVSIDRKMPLALLGMDSLMTVEFKNKLTAQFGNYLSKGLPATVMFDHNNIDSLTDHLLNEALTLDNKSNLTIEKLDSDPAHKPLKVDNREKFAFYNTSPKAIVVANVWAEALFKKDIKMSDNLYELGGDDDVAKIIMQRLRERKITNLGDEVLIEKKTFISLLEAMDSEKHTLPDVQILNQRSMGTTKPVFFFPPAIGSLAYAYNLAGSVRRQCYGFSLPEKSIATSLEDVINIYVNNIMNICEYKKVTLVGWSLGALFSWQVAVKLNQKQWDVDYFQLDAIPLLIPTVESAKTSDLFKTISINQLFTLSRQDEYDLSSFHLDQPLANRAEFIVYFIKQIERCNSYLSELNDEEWEPLLNNLERGLLLLEEGMSTEPYFGKVNLILPSETYVVDLEYNLSLCKGDVVKKFVFGNHFNMTSNPELKKLLSEMLNI